MSAHDQARALYVAAGVTPEAAEQHARDMVAFLRLLIREAQRQEREDAAAQEQAR